MRRLVALQEHRHQRALASGQRLGQSGLLGVACRFQRLGQAGAIFRQEAHRGIARRCIQGLFGSGDQARVRVEQRGRVVDFQPVALGVLGADSKREAQHNAYSLEVSERN